MSENKSIFRKQSMESVSSPEQLGDYITSASPSVWLVLIAIILLLVGVCVWGIFGRLDTTVTTGAVSRGGELLLYISEDNIEKIEDGLTVSVDGQEYTIAEVSASPVLLGAETDAYALHASSLKQGDFAYIAAAHTDLPDGSYKAEITVDSVSPISFVTN
ncbi:MAG: hypothetical protein IJ555_05855 [Ruminococcus sp.]|nr:hypothetical protein [Ruminococcus sp.]MBR1751579.1 hypothetical protein [Ruminococcus sp.]